MCTHKSLLFFLAYSVTVHCKDKHFSSVYFKYVESFSWDYWMQAAEEMRVLGVSREELISFPRLPSPTHDHLSSRWTFVERHPGEELSRVWAFSGCQELESVCDSRTLVHVREEGWGCKICPRKEESRCYTFTTSLFWNWKRLIPSFRAFNIPLTNCPPWKPPLVQLIQCSRNQPFPISADRI